MATQCYKNQGNNTVKNLYSCHKMCSKCVAFLWTLWLPTKGEKKILGCGFELYRTSQNVAPSVKTVWELLTLALKARYKLSGTVTRTHVHHLSVDDGRVLAAVGGGGMWVARLSSHGFYGDELHGARGGFIWIWGAEKEFTHKEATETSDRYSVGQKGTSCHSFFSPSFSPADTVGLCQTSVTCDSK